MKRGLSFMEILSRSLQDTKIYFCRTPELTELTMVPLNVDIKAINRLACVFLSALESFGRADYRR